MKKAHLMRRNRTRVDQERPRVEHETRMGHQALKNRDYHLAIADKVLRHPSYHGLCRCKNSTFNFTKG